MTDFSTPTDEYLIRTQIWSRQLKEMLLDELQAMKFVPVISDEVQFEIVETMHVSLPVAAAMGAAAVIIKNPVVSRRFWRLP